MTKESGSKKRLLRIVVVCVIAAAAFGLLLIAYEANSARLQSYKESEKYVDFSVALLLNKDPNKLTSEDYEKAKDIDVGGNVVNNLKPFAKLKNLNNITFNIAPSQEIDLRPLAKLKSLDRIEFNITRVQYIDLKPLAMIKSLKTLEVVSGSGIPFITKQTRWHEKLLVFLKISRPSDNVVKPFDFGQLRKFENLERLKVQIIDVCNTEALAELKHLKYLELATTQIRNIESLSGLVNLEYLGLRKTGIADISPLANLKNLRELDLRNTNVTKEQIKEFQKALPELEIKR